MFGWTPPAQITNTLALTLSPQSSTISIQHIPKALRELKSGLWTHPCVKLCLLIPEPLSLSEPQESWNCHLGICPHYQGRRTLLMEELVHSGSSGSLTSFFGPIVLLNLDLRTCIVLWGLHSCSVPGLPSKSACGNVFFYHLIAPNFKVTTAHHH